MSNALITMLVLFGCVACSNRNSAAVVACDNTSTCATGEACAFGACVAVGDPRLSEVDIEVEQPLVSSLSVQPVFGVSIGGGEVDLQFRPVAQLPGVVWNGAGGVAALVVATPERIIAGRTQRQAVNGGDDGAFILPLLEGSAYQVTALPVDRSLPARVDVRVVALPDALNIDLGAGVAVTGRVVRSTDNNSVQVVAGASIEVLDVGGRALAAPTTTQADGTFVVVVERFVGGKLCVAPAPADNLPSAEVEVLTADAGDINLGTVAAARRLPVRVLDENGQAVAAAAVSLHGAVGVGVIRRQAVADAAGTTELLVPQADYQVVAVAASGARLQVAQVDVVATTDAWAEPLTLRLPAVHDVWYRLETSDGDAVVGATVRYDLIGDEDGFVGPALAGQPTPSIVGLTDGEGQVAVGLSTGRYRVQIQPPPMSGAPMQSLIVNVNAPIDETITLPPRIVLVGTLRDSVGAAVEGGAVRVFSKLTNEQGAAIFLGEASTDVVGGFAISLPDVAATARQ
jgi:hypothetical protein